MFFQSRIRTVFFLTVLLFCGVFLVSCQKNNAISFEASDSVNLSPDIKWAVITSPYAAFHQECNLDSKVSSNGRKGDVNMVTGEEFVKNTDSKNGYDIWYRFDEGWLFEDDVKIYDNKYKAQTASSELLR